jgi:cytochrome c-type biogenesis protein CcmF
MLLMRGRKESGPAIPKAISSREFGLVTGILLFCVAAAFVLVGTSSPILTGVLGNPSNVTTDYYNQVALPVAIFIALVLGFSPFLLIERTQWGELFKAVFASVIVATIVTAAVIMLTSLRALHALLIFVSVMALCTNALAMWRFSQGRPLRMAGHLTHAGFAIMLLGIIASAAYSGEEMFTMTSGETVSAYGAEIQFIGAVKGDTPEKGYLDLRMIRNGDTVAAHPKLYVSEYSQQVMRTPYIENGFVYDVYLAPLDHKAVEPHAHGLTLTKGQTSEYSGWSITFERYDMSQHGEAGSMSVGAVIKAERDGQSHEITPTMQSTLEGKKSTPIAIPGTELSFALVGMSVEQKSVTLEVSDPNDGHVAAGTESLVLSVSRKPLTSLVWIGCILITVGTALSYWRRRIEERILASMTNHSIPVPPLPKGARLKPALPH